MCGIVGKLNTDGTFPVSDDDAMVDALRRRGPDDSGSVCYDNAWLAHRRLSIIDLDRRSKQPMDDVSGRYSIVYNGEVYNYKNLAKECGDYRFRTTSDTEVVLAAFAHRGPDILAQFRGMFAFAVLDRKLQELWLVRDRWGIKPLLYHFEDGVLTFASELRAFLSDPKFAHLDRLALDGLFEFGSVMQPRTILRGVRQVPPAHYVHVSATGALSVRPYLAVFSSTTEVAKVAYDDAVKETRRLLEKATVANLVADVEVGCFLSGGVDSSAVLALMQRVSDRPVKAFSVGFETQDEVVDESDIAARTAQHIGATFERVSIRDDEVLSLFDEFIEALDQPSIDGFNTFLVSRVASRHVKVAVSGVGGDEVFAGYPHFAWISQREHRPRTLAARVAGWLHSLRPNRLTAARRLDGMPATAAVERVRTIYRRRTRARILKNHTSINRELRRVEYQGSSVHSISAHEIEHYLCNTLLRDSDVLSMWHSLELRPVLLHEDLVTYVLSLPDEYKIRNGVLKSIFIDAIKDLIPKEVWQRKKTGFELPVVRWLNGPLHVRFIETWQSNKAKELFRPRFIRMQTRKANRRVLGRNDWLPFVVLRWLIVLDERLRSERNQLPIGTVAE